MQSEETQAILQKILPESSMRALIVEKFGIPSNLISIHPGNRQSDIYVYIDWILKDPDRPSKRSKRIQIVATEEFLDDYIYNNNYSKIDCIGWFKQRLNQFEPDHDVPKYGESPTEKFIIGSYP